MLDEFQNDQENNNGNNGDGVSHGAEQINNEHATYEQSNNEPNKSEGRMDESNYEFWAENINRTNAKESNNIEEENPVKENQIHNENPNNNSSLDASNNQNAGNNQNLDNNLNSYNTPEVNTNQFNNNPINATYDQADNNSKAQYTENSNFTNSSDSPSKKSKNNKQFAVKTAKLIASAAVFGVVAGGVFLGVNKLDDNINPDQAYSNIATTVNTTASDDKTNLSTTAVAAGTKNQDNDVSDVVSNTMPSIVSIKSTVTQTYQDWFGQTYDQDAEGSGSGIIVGKNDTELLIATNNHVVTGANTIKVTFIDEKEYTAELKGTDETADLAVVAIKLSDISKDTLSQIKIATLGNSDDVKVGQMAIAIGNALGYGQSVTVGYISAKDRKVEISEEQSMVLLQTDAAINPGNSGGALLNADGEVIGINSVKYSSEEVEGMGYAIPISKATPIINDLMNREILKEGEQGYLGITGNDVTTDVSTNYNMPVGVYVNEVSEDGAAAKAGIKTGDIITEVNDIAVQSIAALKEKVNSYRIGTEISVTLMRSSNGEYKEQVVKVTLGKAPETDSKTSENSSTAQDGTSDNSQDNNATDNNQSNPNQSSPFSDGQDGNSSDSSVEDYFNEFFNN